MLSLNNISGKGSKPWRCTYDVRYGNETIFGRIIKTQNKIAKEKKTGRTHIFLFT